MSEIQINFNFDNKSVEECRLAQMQEQIDAASDSMGKVRRSLFAQIGELKKQMYSLKEENMALSQKLQVLSNQKAEWDYDKQDCLFDLKATG